MAEIGVERKRRRAWPLGVALLLPALLFGTMAAKPNGDREEQAAARCPAQAAPAPTAVGAQDREARSQPGAIEGRAEGQAKEEAGETAEARRERVLRMRTRMMA